MGATLLCVLGRRFDSLRLIVLHILLSFCSCLQLQPGAQQCLKGLMKWKPGVLCLSVGQVAEVCCNLPKESALC